MDNEKLRKANALEKKISLLKKEIENLRTVSKKAEDNPDDCKIYIYQENAYVDHDVFEIALFVQERRATDLLSKTEKEFEKL